MGYLHISQDDELIRKLEENPVSWNAHWESQNPGSTMKSLLYGRRSYGTPDESFLAEYRGVFQGLCFLQHELSVKAGIYISAGFEPKWQSTPKAVREKHMLEGHVRACLIRQTDTFRMVCVDITLASLSKNNGRGFLELLESYLLEDTVCPPKTPISVPYTGITSLARGQHDPIIETYALLRDSHLCALFWFS